MDIASITTSVILGAVQGLTEFLPISSSGHLAIVDALFHTKLPLAFVVLLHMATLVAVLFYTFPLIKNIIISIIRLLLHKTYDDMMPSNNTKRQDIQHARLFLALIISTFTTAPIAILLKDPIQEVSIFAIGVAMFITAIILSLPFLIKTTRVKIHNSLLTPSSQSTIPNISLLQASLLGIGQGLAIFPGISRSGVTITIAVLLGISYAHATRYSFLMAIPAILASFLLSVSDLPGLMDHISYIALGISMITACIMGIIGLRCLSIIARKGKIWIFSIYLIILSGIIFIYTM